MISFFFFFFFFFIIRKILANIILDRIQYRIDKYVRANQIGYRRGRSTTEMAWAGQYLTTMIQKFKDSVEILQIDLSKAFDCIDRTLLLKILDDNNITDNDTIRMIQFLLANTTLMVKLDGQNKGLPFTTTTGAPQGDALSAILFIIYQEYIFRTFEEKYSKRNDLISFQWSYADDTSFLEMNVEGHEKSTLDAWTGGADQYDTATKRIRHLTDNLPESFAAGHMQMNSNKSEYHHLSRENLKDTKVTFIKSSINVQTEIKKRIKLANLRMRQIRKVLRLQLRIDKKIQIYNSLVKPILTHNMHALAMKKGDEDTINSFHRRQLRQILGDRKNQQATSCIETYTRTLQTKER
jgi:Reverse transcriptase (RNA-dependent DNA polymerase)